MSYLIKENMWKIRCFFSCNLLLFLIINGLQIYIDLSANIIEKNLLFKGLGGLMPVLLVVVFNGLLDDMWKARIVFWKWKNPLPGCRAFTELINKDPRIDKSKLKEKINPLPEEPHEQNSKWYNIYKIHSDKIIVIESHKSYLLTRDMAALSFIFFVVFSLGSLFIIEIKTALIYSFFMLLQYTVVSIAAKNYGNRFVCNVLVEESHN